MANRAKKIVLILILVLFSTSFVGCSFIEGLSPKEMAFNKGVELYQSDNPDKRKQALDEFLKSGKPEAKEYLEKAANDKDASVRVKAIDTVVKAYGVDSSDLLFEKLFDKDFFVKNKAKSYIKQYKDGLNKVIVDKINNKKLVNDQIKAIRAVSVIKDESYIGYLGDLLFSDANVYVKLEAINALSAFDNEVAQGYVIKSLEANDYSKLIVMGLSSVPKDESLDAIEIIAPHLYSVKYQVAVAALKALKENNNPDAVEPIFNMLEESKLLLNKEFKDECIITLSSLGNNENLKYFLKGLSSQRSDVRSITVKSAVKSKDSDWAKVVIEEALNNDQKDVQIVAMFAVKEHQSKQSIKDLVALLKDENPIVRESAVEAISRIKNAVKYEENFKKALNDPDYSVVRATIKSLGNVKADWSVKYLKEIVITNEDDNFTIIAINSLANFGEDRSVILLLKDQLSNQNSKIADASSFALARMKNTFAKQVLLEELKSDSSDVKIRAINALQLLGDPSVVAKLQQCTKDLDPKVRKKAKLALNYLVNTNKMREIRNRGLK